MGNHKRFGSEVNVTGRICVGHILNQSPGKGTNLVNKVNHKGRSCLNCTYDII